MGTLLAREPSRAPWKRRRCHPCAVMLSGVGVL